MKKYVLEAIKANSYMFTQEEIKFINCNIKMIIKIFRLGMIDRFNISEGSF